MEDGKQTYTQYVREQERSREQPTNAKGETEPDLFEIYGPQEIEPQDIDFFNEPDEPDEPDEVEDQNLG